MKIGRLKTIFFLLVGIELLMTPGSIHAQTIRWVRCFGGSLIDECYDIQQTSDGGYIMAGVTESIDGDVTGNHGGKDYWIVKTDDWGNLQWQKCYGGTSDDIATSIRQTNDGNFIVAGYSNSGDGDVTINHGGSDFWVIKIDAVGNLIWEKSLGGSSTETDCKVRLSNDETFIIAGNSDSDDGDVSGNHGLTDYWIVKIDSAGTIIWQRAAGGSASDQLKGVSATADHGAIVCGISESSDGDVPPFCYTNYCSWIVKLDSTGSIQWQQMDSVFNGGITVSDVLQMSSGNFLSSGSMYNYGNHHNFAVLQLNSSGSIIQRSSFTGNDFDFSNSIASTPNHGGYIMAGYTLWPTNSFFVLKTAGISTQWTIFTNQTLPSVSWTAAETIDGGFIFNTNYFQDSSANCFSPLLDFNYYLIKIDGALADVPEHAGITGINASVDNSFLSVQWNTYQTCRLEIKLSDISRRTLYKDEIESSSGMNRIKLNVVDLAQGIYFISLRGSMISETIKFIK